MTDSQREAPLGSLARRRARVEAALDRYRRRLMEAKAQEAEAMVRLRRLQARLEQLSRGQESQENAV